VKNDGSVTIRNGDITINKGSINLGATENGVTYKCIIDNNGKITAQNADIQGAITAESGKIGIWTINEDGVLSATGTEE
jgi:hypothetical protein